MVKNMRERPKKSTNKILLCFCCIITTIAFQLKLDIIENIDTSFLTSLISFIKSFHQYNIIYILLIPAFYHFYQYILLNTGGGIKHPI